MADDLNNALKQFDAVQANLHKLERLWETIDKMLPSGNEVQQVEDDKTYRDAVRRFEFIAGTMPKIDGYGLSPSFSNPESIFNCAIEYLDFRDEQPFGIAQYHEGLRDPGEQLREYRFRVGIARRKLARETIGEFISKVDDLLVVLARKAEGKEVNKLLKAEEEWEQLESAVKAISTLLGDAVARPPSWGDLSRHLYFGMVGDFNDIVKRDWPLSKAGLEPLLYGDDDPLPVSVKDLGSLVASKPRGPVTTELQWERLSPADFERLIFNLVDRTDGYDSPEWLTHTNAPDRGRDVSVYRVQKDALTSGRRLRIILACKRQKSVGLPDVTLLREQMKLWTTPRVDELIIATTGRFSTDAVQWIDQHNAGGESLRIEMWPESHIERLLSERPELIAEFNLR